MKNYRVVNLELTLPAVRDMPERITREVRQARAHQIRVIKFIHGYGSTGRGGPRLSGRTDCLLYPRRKTVHLRRRHPACPAPVR